MRELQLCRFPISEREDRYVLVQVLSNGSKTLDVKLIGTDGAEAFSTKIRQSRIKELKADNDDCTEEEWDEILASTLLKPDGGVKAIVIEAVVQSEKDLTLTFRKNVQGIKHRMGSIVLKKDAQAEDDTDLFGWCVTVTGTRAKLAEELTTANATAARLEQDVKKLESQLEELTEARKKDETILLEKFQNLLNEKKVRIRNQQRLLASAEVDPDKLANVGASQGTIRKAQGSRNNKRRTPEEFSDSDDHFEKMEVDQGPGNSKEAEVDSDADEQQTTEDETQSEGDTADEAPVPPSKAPKGKKAAASRTAASKSGTSMASNSKKSPVVEKPMSQTVEEEDIEPPSRRALPFNQEKKSAPKPDPADDETDSGDDEL